jgi:hypothetical protein
MDKQKSHPGMIGDVLGRWPKSQGMGQPIVFIADGSFKT